MNVLILAAGQTNFDSHDGTYPACLTEIDDHPIIERVVNACRLSSDTRFTFALKKEDAQRHHLDNVLLLLAPDANLFHVEGGTRGAACTALLAAGWIDSDKELLIASSNELLDIDLNTVIRHFRAQALDAGVITFPSVHPRYSYVRLDEQGHVTETAEKNPISRNAMTGIYWFLRGSDFIRAAQNMIRKDAHVDGLFYIAPTLNNLILEGRRIGTFPIEASHYHPLKTERQLDRFTNTLAHGATP